MLLKQEGAPVFSVNLSTREFDGYVIVALGRELDLVPMTVKDGLAFQSAAHNVATRDPAAGVPFAGCADGR